MSKTEAITPLLNSRPPWVASSVCRFSIDAWTEFEAGICMLTPAFPCTLHIGYRLLDWVTFFATIFATKKKLGKNRQARKSLLAEMRIKRTTRTHSYRYSTRNRTLQTSTNRWWAHFPRLAISPHDSNPACGGYQHLVADTGNKYTCRVHRDYMPFLAIRTLLSLFAKLVVIQKVWKHLFPIVFIPIFFSFKFIFHFIFSPFLIIFSSNSFSSLFSTFSHYFFSYFFSNFFSHFFAFPESSDASSMLPRKKMHGRPKQERHGSQSWGWWLIYSRDFHIHT